MFKALKIGSIVFLVLVVVGALWLNQRNVRAAKNGVKGPVEYDFPQGGNITLDLSAGDYEIRGILDNKIRVRYSYSEYLRDTASITAKVNGSNANISIDGPSNSGFHVVIEVPQVSNLKTSLSAGKLSLRGVDGNKDLDANAGKIGVEIGDPGQYRDVSLNLISGKVEARPWHKNSGGLFRSFEHHGAKGEYHINANLLVGELTVDSLRSDASELPPTPPAPPQAPHFD